MSFTVDEKWLKEYYARQGRTAPGNNEIPEEAVVRRKYGNIPVETEEGKFDSKHEEAAWRLLKARAKDGEFIMLARQADFLLPGGIVYRADFIAIGADRTAHIYDAKSPATRKDKVYRLKRRLMKEELGYEIEEL